VSGSRPSACSTNVLNGTSRHFAVPQNSVAIGITADMPNGFSEVKSSKREAAVLPGSYSLGHRRQKGEKVKLSRARSLFCRRSLFCCTFYL
jgi:hypothetical protein